eukprot:GDKJ01021889.1.p1 GENE.GDKJ01021889.1~~GDKJ01021889.1.p1  ORF type:complete len:220 (+),score=34.78 GDKJ01021889.1:35-694(+)
MRRVCIVGGSFDPPTVAHIQSSSELISLDICDEVWMMPCGPRPDKNLRCSYDTRVEMLEKTIVDLLGSTDKMKVSRMEENCTVSIPTALVMEELNQKYGDQYSFKFSIGADLIKDLHKWRHPEKLLSEVHFVISPRPGYGTANDLPVEIRPKKFEEVAQIAASLGITLVESNISSTMVRDRLQKGAFVGSLITPTVQKIILESDDCRKAYHIPNHHEKC